MESDVEMKIALKETPASLASFPASIITKKIVWEIGISDIYLVKFFSIQELSLIVVEQLTQFIYIWIKGDTGGLQPSLANIWIVFKGEDQ